METRKIELTVTTAERWANGTDEELKQLALSTFPELAKKELPKSFSEIGIVKGWFINDNEDIKETDKCEDRKGFRFCFATREQAEASIALAQLSQLKAVYNDGWVADWENYNQNKFCIEFYQNELSKNCLSLFSIASKVFD